MICKPSDSWLKHKTKMENEAIFLDVSNTSDAGKTEFQVIVDKEKASRMGLNAAMVGLQLRQAVYGIEAGNYTEQGEDYPIILRYAADARAEVGQLENIMLTNLLNQQVPLSAVANFKQVNSRLEIQRKKPGKDCFREGRCARCFSGRGRRFSGKLYCNVGYSGGC